MSVVLLIGVGVVVVAVWLFAIALCVAAGRADREMERAEHERAVDRWNRVGDSLDRIWR